MSGRLDDDAPRPGLLRRPAVVGVLSAGVCVLAMRAVAGEGVLSAAWVVVTEAPLAAAILVSAGGFGAPVVRALAGKAGSSGLRMATSAAVGLWLVSLAVLAGGAVVPGGLSGWAWWPILAVGFALAVWQGLGTLRRVAGRRVRVTRLYWAAAMLSAGLWLGGATCPPGLVSLGGDAYDVLEYHLQLPREFLRTGSTMPVSHNVYSHYPLGVEMLYLLAMILRGGAYEGMYLAKLLHGAMGALGAIALLSERVPRQGGASSRTPRTVPDDSKPLPARDADSDACGEDAPPADAPVGSAVFPGAGLLLAASPILLYLSWLAFAELAQVMYLTLGLLWLIRWLSARSAGSAALIGLLCGAACGTKYLAAGMVAGPMLAVMAVLAVTTRRRFWPVGVAAVLCVAAWAPWGVRNAVAVGNPVFPLATRLLGRGHWSSMEQQRWIDGHGPEKHPPVPIPPDWSPPDDAPSRAMVALGNVLSPPALLRLGGGLAVLAAAGVIVTLARAELRWWGLALTSVLTVQVALWGALAHGLPQRFLVPALGPMALLAQATLWTLTGPSRTWRRRLAALVAVLAVGVGWLGAMREGEAVRLAAHGASGAEVARAFEPDVWALPAGSRVLLVGQATAFYMPPGTIYATAFDPHPLAEMARRGLSGEAMLAALHDMGVTHVQVHHAEIDRLRGSYGYPALLSQGVESEPLGGPIVAALAPLVELGLRPIKPTMTPTPGRTLYALPRLRPGLPPAGNGEQEPLPE